MRGFTKRDSATSTLRSLYLLLTLFSVMSNTATTPGATLTVRWQYTNPGSLLEDGNTCDRYGDKRCDVYIEFCMRQAFPERPQPVDNCQILNKRTPLANNADDWSSSMEGNHIPAPVKTYYTLEATVYDSDVFFHKQKIRKFTARNFALYPTSVFTAIPLDTQTDGVKNPKMKLKVEARLTCHMDYYGNECNRFCQGTSMSKCDSEGNSVCHAGLRGEGCDIEDACHFEPCAKHAKCVNRDDRPGRICLCNDSEGPECYPGYDPCQRNPCENNGTCRHTGKFNASFMCNCTLGWVGHRCNERLTACKAAEMKLLAGEVESNSVRTGSAHTASVLGLAVCLNGGTCQDHADEFKYHCVCPPGWAGEKCETPVLPITMTHLTLYTLSIAVVFCVGLAVVIAILAYRYRRSRQVLRYMSKAGGIVYFNRDSDMVSLNNGSDYQAHFIDHIYRDMKAGSSRATSLVPNRTKSENNTDSEVYDECNPVGGDPASNPYGTVFDVEPRPPSANQASSVSSGHDTAPPLPERPFPLPISSPQYQQSLPESGQDNSAYRLSGRPELEMSPGYNTGSRTSRIYRPISPPVFVPGSALDRIDGTPNE